MTVRVLGGGAGSKNVTGVYMPQDWGTLWRAKRATAGASPVLVGGFGASITEGYYTSNWMTKPWFMVAINALQAKYGDGGSGWVSVHSITGIAAASARLSVTATGTLGTGVGGWDSYAHGPNSYMLFAHAAANGATMVDTNVRGRFIDISYLPTTTAGVSFNYAVSGGGPSGNKSTTAASTPDMGILTIDRGAGNTGQCTLTITVSTGQPFIAGWCGRNAAGIIPILNGLAGRTSGDITTASAVGLLTTRTTGYVSVANACGIGQGFLDLFVYGADMLINDVAAASTAITAAFNMAIAFDYARSGAGGVGGNANCELLAVAPHKGNTTDTGELYAAYMRELRAVCEAYGAALISEWPRGRNSWAYSNALGYWGDGTNDGLAGSNVVHPSDAGHLSKGTFVASVLAA